MNKALKWAGYVLLAIVILFFALFLNLESASYFIVRQAAKFYGSRAGIAVAVGRISGKPFAETTVENLSIRPSDGQPQIYHFSAQSITCTYNLWDLKKGYEFFLRGLSCSSDGPDFSYDFRLASPDGQSPDESAQFMMPAILPALNLSNGRVVLTDADWDIEASGMHASLRSTAGSHELQLAVDGFRFNREGLTRIDAGFVSELRYTGGALTIDSLKIAAEQVSATGFIDLAMLGREQARFGAELAFAESRLNIEGFLEKEFLKVQAQTDNFDIAELQKRLAGADWDLTGKVKGEADLALNLKTLENLNASFAVAVQQGKLHGVDIDVVSLHGSLDNAFLKISAAEAKTPGNYLRLSEVSVPMPLLQEGDPLAILGGSWAIFEADIADFTTFLQLIKVEDDLLAEALRPDSVAIQGHLAMGVVNLAGGRAANAEASLAVKRGIIPVPATKEVFESVELDLGLHLESSNLQRIVGLFGEVPVNGQAAADISITGSIKTPQVKMSLSGAYLGIMEMQLGGLSFQGDCRLVQEQLGQIESVAFEITELIQENASGTLTLLSPVSGGWQNEKFAMNAAFQLDGKGEISAGINRAPGKEITVEISTRSLDSDGWLGNFIDPRYFFHGADIEAVLRGLFEATQLQISGTVSEAGGTGVPFPLTGSFALDYSPKGIELKEFTWKSLERNQLSLTGFLPFDPMVAEPFLAGNLALQGHIDFPALEDIAVFLEPWGIGRGSVRADMDLAGTWDRPVGHLLFQADGLEPPDKMRKYVDSPVNIAVDLAVQGDSMVLRSGSLDSVKYTAQATGSWQHGISARELLQKHRADLKGEVSADVIVQLKDLNFLRQKFPWLRRLEGDLQAELHLAGPAAKPSLNGSFSLRDGEASHSFNFPMLSAVNLQGYFDEHSISIENLQAEVGGSPVNLQGRLTRENEIVAVSLHVDGKNVLLFRNNDMWMRGDVQLDISGPLTRLLVKGATGLTGGYYTKNYEFLGMIGSSSAPVSEGVSFLFSFPDQPLKDAVFDIKITTIEPFRIRNNLARFILRPELTLKGTGELPFLVGTLYIDPSRVLLPSGRLQIQSGLLRFLEREPDRPQLDLLGQSRIMGYDINVVISGPIDDPVITLSSSPSLPNDDLLLLLLTGQPPRQDAAGQGMGRATTNVMVYLGRDFLNKWLDDESGASSENILERFELDYGRNITKSGEQTVEGTFRLSEYTAGTGKIYYLSAEKDKYDAFNYGLKLVFRFE